MRVPVLLLRRVTIAWIALTCCGGPATSVAAQNPMTQAKVASIPVEITDDNYVLIKARVNDSEPLTFILDSAAGSGLVLYFKAAQALGLKGEGKGRGGGSGESTFETSSIKGASLTLPGVAMNNQTFVVYPPDRAAPNIGRLIDGVIGYTLFSRYVVEIDYQFQIVSLYEPATYQNGGAGESIPLNILSKLPFASMKIPLEGRKPLEGQFMVDSGAGRFTLILNTPVVTANNLLAAAPRTITELGAGVGGEAKLLVGRLPNLQLGHFTLTGPVIHFAQDRKGALASSDFSGVIGGDLLRRFKVIFDYAHRRMILEPNKSFADPFEYDMSGIRLRADGPDFKILKVWRVVENSPATEAGVREGDVVSAIDGRPASEFSLSKINQMFKQEGRDYLLDIIRGEEKKRLRLKLRRLI